MSSCMYICTLHECSTGTRNLHVEMVSRVCVYTHLLLYVVLVCSKNFMVNIFFNECTGMS